MTLGRCSKRMLEPAAAHVAEHAPPAERAAIAAVAERGIAPDGADYYEFHDLLVRASGNPILTTVLAAVEQAVRWAVAEQDITQYDRDEAARPHRAIAKAITAGDARKAENPMRLHFLAALAHVEASGLLSTPMIPPSRWRGRHRRHSVAANGATSPRSAPCPTCRRRSPPPRHQYTTAAWSSGCSCGRRWAG